MELEDEVVYYLTIDILYQLYAGASSAGGTGGTCPPCALFVSPPRFKANVLFCVFVMLAPLKLVKCPPHAAPCPGRRRLLEGFRRLLEGCRRL